MESRGRRSEQERLDSLRSYRIFGIENETDADREAGAGSDEPFLVLCNVAARLCDTPIAAVNLVDEEQVWSLAATGWARRGAIVRRRSFTADVVTSGAPVVVPDASVDERYSDVEVTITAPRVRAYAGVPLGSRDGLVLGAFCVMDVRPRDFTGEQVQLLSGLAAQAMALLELRRLRLLILPLTSVAEQAVAILRSGAMTVPALDTVSTAALEGLFTGDDARGAGRLPRAEVPEIARLSLLSSRELDIVGRLVHGDRVPAIAEMLFLSPSTVRNHLSSVFRKLRVGSQQELVNLIRDRTRPGAEEPEDGHGSS